MNLLIEDALKMGIEAHKTGQIEQASIFYKKVLQLQPEHPDANHNLGVVACETGKTVDALPLFITALEGDASVGYYWLSYIQALIKLGMAEDAQIVLNQAKKIGAKGEEFDKCEMIISELKNSMNQNIEGSIKSTINILNHLDLDQALRLAQKNAAECLFDEAKKICEDILVKFPQNRKAKDLLQTFVSKNTNTASQLQMLCLEPPQDFLEKVNHLRAQGKLLEAQFEAARLFEKFPSSASVYNIQGIVNSDLGRFDASINCFRNAIERAPDYADAHYNLGKVLQDRSDIDGAIKCYKQAIKYRPGYASAYYNMGITLSENGDLDGAINSYKMAVGYEPEKFEHNYTLGLALLQTEDFKNAISAINQAIKIRPNHAAPHYYLGCALKLSGDIEEAMSSYQQTVILKPEYHEAYCKMGNILAAKGDFEEANKCYSQAIELKPDYAEAHNDLAIMLRETGKQEASIESGSKAIAFKPDFAEAYCSNSLSYLLNGDMEIGFELYEWRTRLQTKVSTKPARQPFIWDGKSDLSGKRFFVYQEQGIGDVIQFSRYLSLLASQGAFVDFLTNSRVQWLLRSLAGNINLRTEEPSDECIDFEAPLLSLPYLFGTNLNNIPAKGHYLLAEKTRVKSWGEKIKADTFKVGICWQGSNGVLDKGRSFPLSLFKGISRIPGIELISLHKGAGESQIAGIDFALTSLGTEFDSGQDAFFDTSAVMMNCDLIITSDTAVAHLAGALGRKTWIVLKNIPEWRWMLNRNDSPWYPSVTLYRQEKRNCWTDVFDNIERDLSTLMEKR